MVVFLFIIGLLFLVFLSSSGSEKAAKKPTKIEFINSCLPQTLVTTVNSELSSYCINIPIKIYNLHRHPSNGSERIYFDFIYFSMLNGELSTGETVISYGLDELYTIFQNAIKNKESNIYINFISRTLTIFSDDNHNIHNSNKLRGLYEELKNIEQKLGNLNKEVVKVESLLNVIAPSNLYQYQSETYRRGLSLLKQSQAKATAIKEGYLTIIREYILSFYLADVGDAIFKTESQEIASEVKYKLFKEDYYDLLQNMKEYRKLKLETLS